MLTGKKVLVIGLARSGKAAVKLLQKLNATITINEGKELEKIEGYQEYLDAGIEIIAGGHPDELFERDFDFVVKNPGINYHKPFILRLKERGIPVYTEIELAYQVAKKQHYIAVTGTNGKTTTVTLIYEILKAQYEHVHFAGNIGKPLCDVVLENNLLEEENHYIVIEMSNFQLLDIDKFRPEISTVINLTPDHLDYMASLDEYYASKMRIYENCESDDEVFVNNIDDETLQEYLQRYHVYCCVLTQSLNKPADCSIIDQAIYFRGEHIIDLKDIKIVGDHNVQNIMIATTICLVAGVSPRVIKDVVSHFKGVEHRIEYVDTVKGVAYYNDSKGTNPDAAIKGIKAMNRPTWLIGGGYDKKSTYDEWIEAFDGKVKELILMGVTAPKIADCAKTHGFDKIKFVDSMEEAVSYIAGKAQDGEAVLLSPACASWGMFDNYEQRGDMFKEYVNKLD